MSATERSATPLSTLAVWLGSAYGSIAEQFNGFVSQYAILSPSILSLCLIPAQDELCAQLGLGLEFDGVNVPVPADPEMRSEVEIERLFYNLIQD